MVWPILIGIYRAFIETPVYHIWKWYQMYNIALFSVGSNCAMIVTAYGLLFLEHLGLTAKITLCVALGALYFITMFLFYSPDGFRALLHNRMLSTIVDVIGNSVMLLVGIFISRWEETSMYSIYLFGGLSVWALCLICVSRPPTDFGIFVYLVTLTLNQILRHFNPHSNIVFYCWAVSSVLLVLMKVFNPRPREVPLIPG